jgi:eukaryotic-like serine/threonine-protein kinase
MAERKCCPRCGLELPANAGHSFCPACLLLQGMDSEAISLAHPGEPGVTTTWSEGVPHRSVLDILRNAVGEVPSVLLRDPEPGMESPEDRASSSEPPKDKGRYQILGEIDHGGMGAVFKGRDRDLGRDLAIKVLLDEHHDDPVMTRRFVEEAQIGGQLQHPGIVPIYELGSFDDLRPYFTMKLVKGRTMAALLKERAGPAHDLPRFLSIFEQVCQTMAYAHARGVIHRDLKPLNIMVGAFGEVQVMDWGLAKVLPKGGTNDETRPQTDEPAASVIWTVRAESDDESRRVSVRGGTPAYMAPEQANDDVEAMDERADVFGLGSILCEILTGRPAYTGQSSDAILRKAKRGDTGDALRRLNGSGADGELIAVARDCLGADPAERPREAGEVARRITAYFAGVQDRLRAAELARAAEEARAEEAQATAVAAEGRARAERRARRMTVGMAASILIAAALGAAGWRWMERNRMVRLAAITGRVNTAVQEATGLWGQAQVAAVGDLIAWTKALAAAQKARELLEPGLDLSLRRQVEGLLARIASEKEGAEAAARAAETDRLLLDKLVEIRSGKADDPDGSISDHDYSAAFREAGIDVTALPASDAGAKIRARPPMVAAALVAALDDWAAVRRLRPNDPLLTIFSRGPEWLANAADPDVWRVSLRNALDLVDSALRTKALRDLAASTKRETAPAIDLDLLGKALSEVGEREAAEEVLRAGLLRFADDVWLNYDLAGLLKSQSRREEAVRYYSVARALRPDTAHELAHVFEEKGELVEAIAVFRDLVRLRPDDGRHWVCYGGLLRKTRGLQGSSEALQTAVGIFRRKIQLKPDDSFIHGLLAGALKNQGKLDEAIAANREAIRISPDKAGSHCNLGVVLMGQGKLDEAVAEFRGAIRFQPDLAVAHSNLGAALNLLGKPAEAIAASREAIRINPKYALAHTILGNALLAQDKLDEAIAEHREAIRLNPNFTEAHNNLGGALRDQGKLEEAVAECREAIRIDPENSAAHDNLGNVLTDQGKLDEAIVEYKAAIRISPDEANPRNGFGNALRDQRKLAEAIAAYREAIRLKPEFAEAHTNLGNALHDQGKLVEGIAEHREAIRLKPEFAEAHSNLGDSLRAQGKLDEAIAECREAIRIEPENWQAHSNLGNALRDQRKLEEAIAEFREAIRIQPDDATVLCNFGVALAAQGKLAEAIAAYREAIRLNPNFTEAHNNLGGALQDQGKLEEAVAECREAIRINPENSAAHSNLGVALKDQGKLAEAIAAYREAIRINPDYAMGHSNLGDALLVEGKLDEAIAECREAIRINPEYAMGHSNLGSALRAQGKLDEAVAAHREAIRLEPDDAGAHTSLGNALHDQAKLEKAIAAHREAIRINPEYAIAHSNLGIALQGQGKLEEAIAEYKEAIRLQPGEAGAHNNWAWALVFPPKRPQREYDEGLAHARKAVELAPKEGGYFNTLALAEYRSGHWAESLAASERSMELGKGGVAYDWFFQAMARSQRGDKDKARKWFDRAVVWTKEKDPQSAELRQFWAEASELLGQPGPAAYVAGSPAGPAGEKREAARLEPDSNKARSADLSTTKKEGTRDEAISLAKRWPDVLKGTDRPRDTAERLAFAQMAYDCKLLVTATRFWAEAFAADPKLGADRDAQRLYHASHAAILAAFGKSKDEPPPDDPAKMRLRAQALVWLKADLASWAKVLESGSARDRVGLSNAMQRWKSETDLAGVRAPDALRQLPGREQSRWRTLWAGVETLLKPEDCWVHTRLGEALSMEGQRHEAAAEFAKAIGLAPYDGVNCFNMAMAMRGQGQNGPALELLTRAAQWDFEHNDHTGLAVWVRGEMLRETGRYDEAVANYRRIAPFAHASPDDRRKAEGEITLTEAYRRSHAARAAALAGCGLGKDSPSADAMAKAKLRAQALDWLKAELAGLAKAHESGTRETKPTLIRTMEYWKNAPDFTGVREPNALAKLPEDERKNWQALWADVERLLKTVTVKAG